MNPGHEDQGGAAIVNPGPEGFVTGEPGSSRGGAAVRPAGIGGYDRLYCSVRLVGYVAGVPHVEAECFLL